MPPPFALPLGSAILPPPTPRLSLLTKLMAGGSPMGAFSVPVLVGVGLPGTKGPLGTVHSDLLTSESNLGRCGGEGGAFYVFLSSFFFLGGAGPGDAGGRTEY